MAARNPLPTEKAAVQLTSAQARRIWLHGQRLDTTEPFSSSPKATPAAVAHLGYLQIDPIYVIERSHHLLDPTLSRTCRSRACDFMCATCARIGSDVSSG